MGNHKDKKQEAAREEAKKNGYITPGMQGTPDGESVPRYRKRGSEVIMQGMNNSFVILGKDREGYFSGEGSTPKGKCGAVDIVAGLASAEGLKLENNKLKSPDFFKDGSRLYLSQKSDVDAYFAIAKGSVKTSTFRKSAAVLKADHTRIIGKEHVKIVAGKARTKGEEKNSGGGVNEPHGGIDLLAGNYDEEGALQPVVKGRNLENFLKDLLGIINDMNNRIFKNQTMILQTATHALYHAHPTPGLPAPTLIFGITPEVIKGYTEITTTSAIAFDIAKIDKIEYLQPGNDLYINSSLVHTT